LALFFGLIFLAALAGQALTGVAEYNNQQLTDGLEQISLGQYLTSSSFSVDVAENWQSEYLQFFLYIYATVWLLQKGSPESKPLGKQGRESDKEQKVGEHADESSPDWVRTRGFRLALYSRSLGVVMGLIFVFSWLAQSIAGAAPLTNNSSANSRTRSAGPPMRCPRISGTAPCRTGNRNSSPSAAWSCCRSTCGNGDHRNPKR
jgi:hypothetical protein